MQNSWAAIPLLGLLLGLANHARGRGALLGGRWACAAIGGLGIGFTAMIMGFDFARAAAIGVSSIFGFYNWLCWGWGLYFAAFTGEWPEETEISWIDDFCLGLIPLKTTGKDRTNYLRGWLGMSLRGLYLVPMFMLFDPLGGHIIAPVWWLGILGLLQGCFYAVNRFDGVYERYGVAIPELLCGTLVGACAGIALIYLSNLDKMGALGL